MAHRCRAGPKQVSSILRQLLSQGSRLLRSSVAMTVPEDPRICTKSLCLSSSPSRLPGPTCHGVGLSILVWLISWKSYLAVLSICPLFAFRSNSPRSCLSSGELWVKSFKYLLFPSSLPSPCLPVFISFYCRRSSLLQPLRFFLQSRFHHGFWPRLSFWLSGVRFPGMGFSWRAKRPPSPGSSSSTIASGRSR